MGWWILTGYVVGFLVCWIIAFRMMFYGEMGPSDDSLGGLMEAILLNGFVSFIMSFFWPIIVLIFMVWRWFIKPRQTNA